MLKVLFSLFSFIARGAQLDNRVDPPPGAPTLFGLYINELETYLDETNGGTPFYLIWWLPFFSMLTRFFCSLNLGHAYKDFHTN